MAATVPVEPLPLTFMIRLVGTLLQAPRSNPAIYMAFSIKVRSCRLTRLGCSCPAKKCR